MFSSVKKKKKGHQKVSILWKQSIWVPCPSWCSPSWSAECLSDSVLQLDSQCSPVSPPQDAGSPGNTNATSRSRSFFREEERTRSTVTRNKNRARTRTNEQHRLRWKLKKLNHRNFIFCEAGSVFIHWLRRRGGVGGERRPPWSSPSLLPAPHAAGPPAAGAAPPPSPALTGPPPASPCSPAPAFCTHSWEERRWNAKPCIPSRNAPLQETISNNNQT